MTTAGKIARGLGVLYVAFISMFALDVFGPDFSVVALLMHLVPSAVLIALLIAAWRHPIVGVYGYPLLAFVYVWMMRGGFDPLNFLIVAGPLFVLSALFASELRTVKPPSSPTAPRSDL